MFPVRPQKEKINIFLKTYKSIFTFIMAEDNNAQCHCHSVLMYSDSEKRFRAFLFLCIFQFVQLSGVPMPFLTAGVLQDETPSGVQVAPVSLQLLQVPRTGFASHGVVTDAREFLPHARLPVNPSQ